MKTKAAILYRTGEPLAVEEIEVPSLQKGQVLVKIFYSGVCHSQLMEAGGKRGEDRYLPHLMGHEATGEVVDTGEGVTKVKRGERIVLTWIKGSGINSPGAIYRKGDTTINAGAVTTFSEFSVVSENRCVALPEGIPMDIGALFGCAVLTGAGIVMNTMKPEKGSTAAVFGMGGIGLSALAALKFHNCSIVVAVDIENEKLALAKEFGATHTVNSAIDDPVQRIKEITGGNGADYSVEAAGRADTIEQAFRAVRNFGGLCVFASHPAFGDMIRIDPFDLICGKRIQGSWGGESDPDKDIPVLARLYLEGELPLEKLINKRYPLERINDALKDIENRKVARGLLEIGRV